MTTDDDVGRRRQETRSGEGADARFAEEAAACFRAGFEAFHAGEPLVAAPRPPSFDRAWWRIGWTGAALARRARGARPFVLPYEPEAVGTKP